MSQASIVLLTSAIEPMKGLIKFLSVCIDLRNLKASVILMTRDQSGKPAPATDISRPSNNQ